MNGYHSHVPYTCGWVDHLSYEFLCYYRDCVWSTPVPFDVSYCHLSEGSRGQYVHDLLGFLPTWKNQKNVVLSSLVKRFKWLPTTTPRQITQKVRCFLLILLGTTIFCETGHEVSIALLGPLRDLDRVATFDWCSAALSDLYYRLDTVCRGAVTMCGFWHVLHVCFFILFIFLSLASFSLLILFFSDLGYRGWTHSRL